MIVIKYIAFYSVNDSLADYYVSGRPHSRGCFVGMGMGGHTKYRIYP